MQENHDGNVLVLKGVCKEFPGVKALTDVDLTIRRGEVHALVGENGAGKSTLMKILSGAYKKDGGTILFNGREVEIGTPKAAERLGISIIHQELNLMGQPDGRGEHPSSAGSRGPAASSSGKRCSTTRRRFSGGSALTATSGVRWAS